MLFVMGRITKKGENMKCLKIGTFISVVILFTLGAGWKTGCPEGCQPYEDFDSILVNYKVITSDSAHSTVNIGIDWSGGAFYANATNHFYKSGAIDDDLWGILDFTPQIIMGGSAVVDSVFILVKCGTDDSVHLFLQKLYGGESVTDIDSVWFNPPDNVWTESPNMLPNHGDYTTEDQYLLRIRAKCICGGADQIRIAYYCKAVYHLE